MTLDESQEKFRTKPSRENAIIYLTTVVQYYKNEMVGLDTLSSAVTEVETAKLNGLF